MVNQLFNIYIYYIFKYSHRSRLQKQMPIWKDVIRNQQRYNSVKQLPRQLEQLIDQASIRFSTCYASPSVLKMLQKSIIEAPQSLEELSFEFQSSIYQDKFVEFQSVFSAGSKFYNLLNYANIKLPNQLLPKTDKNGINFPKQLDGYDEKHFASLCDTLSIYIPKMTNLKVLSLFNAPDFLLEQLELPNSLQVLIIDGLKASHIPKILTQISNLKNLFVFSLSNTDLSKLQPQLTQFLQDNQNRNNQSFSATLSKHYGPCSRHTPDHEVRSCYTESEKLIFKQRFECIGIEFLALTNCQIDSKFGQNLVEILAKDSGIQLLDLSNNQIDLIMQRRLDCSEDQLSWKKYLTTSLNNQMQRQAPSEIIQQVKRTSLAEAEKYELEELKTHFLCQILQTNYTIRKIVLSDEISECLSQYVSLKTQVNAEQLNCAINEICKSTDFIESRDKQEYVVLSAMKSCRFLLQSALQKPQISCQKEGKVVKKKVVKAVKDEKIVDNIRKVKDGKSPGKSASSSKKAGKSPKHVSKPSIKGSNSTTTCGMTSTNDTSTRFSTTTRGTVKSRSTFSRLNNQRKMSGSTFRVDSTIMSNSSAMKRSNTPVSGDTSMITGLTGTTGTTTQMSHKSGKSSKLTPKKKKSVLNDKISRTDEISDESNLKLKELMKPFRPVEEEPQQQETVEVNNEELKQKIVDLVYELLMFNCDGDKSRARQIFIQNQKRLMEYVGKLMIDVERGGMNMDGVRQQLFAFLENAIMD